MPSNHWTKQQIKAFAKQIHTSAVGKAWDFLVPEIQHAVVDAKVLAVIRLQTGETVPVEAIQDLSVMLHDEMGTDDSWGL